MSNTELFPLKSVQSENKNLKSMVSQYVRYWYWFLLCTVLAIAIAFIYLRYYAVPQYRVYSTMLVKDDRSEKGFSNTDALNDLSSFKSTLNIENEIEVLKSKSLMQRVVSELGLFTSYIIEGRIVDREIYGQDVPFKVLINKLDSTAAGKAFVVTLKPGNSFTLDDYSGKVTTHSFGQQIQKPYATFTIVSINALNNSKGKIIVRFNNIQQIASHYNQSILIEPNNKNGSVLSLILVDPVPTKAKNIVNKLMNVYNKEAIEDKNLMATNTLKFLDERLQYVTADLLGVEKEVAKYKSKNGLTDIVTQASDYTLQASSYGKQLSDWAIQIEVLQSIETYLKNGVNQYSMVPSTLGIQDPILLGLIGKFNELQMERERMLRTTQLNNPLVQNMSEQLANLRLNILENLRNIKKGLEITSENLKASSGQFQSRVRRVPGMEQALLEINREKSIKQNIYVYLLQKREETALALAATASVARVIDPAMGGDYAISPNVQTIYLMALLIGLGIPFAAIYISNLLNGKVQTQQDVTDIVSIPILGEIVHNGTNQNAVVVATNTRSPIAEMFRLIRSNLNFATLGKEHITLLVTSSRSGEGKTFVSINLAASLAITGKSVILLDLDLRNPTITSKLRLADGIGITDYLVSSTISLKEIIKHSEDISDLSIISAGSLPTNPSELMMSSKFTHLIQELKQTFDYIIIDTSPVGQVADAFTISSLIDHTIYLVRYNYTYKAWLSIADKIYKDGTLNNMMLILNDAKAINGSNYGYGYGYGYGNKEAFAGGLNSNNFFRKNNNAK